MCMLRLILNFSNIGIVFQKYRRATLAKFSSRQSSLFIIEIF